MIFLLQDCNKCNKNNNVKIISYSNLDRGQSDNNNIPHCSDLCIKCRKVSLVRNIFLLHPNPSLTCQLLHYLIEVIFLVSLAAQAARETCGTPTPAQATPCASDPRHTSCTLRVHFVQGDMVKEKSPKFPLEEIK